ncbi:WD40/YVTN/BNR-like repeat-containing protein [Clostridium rectalis]|uniref:WD40/YVTN/BNR-like repeat-containing protein n=1 Tax=Clostridium rectalis TaxID=2040295 RepID=UPI000F6312CF|nr:hypothetical protein [Clostridium rectalis]
MKRLYSFWIILILCILSMCFVIYKNNNEYSYVFNEKGAEQYNFLDIKMLDSYSGWAIAKEGILKTDSGIKKWNNVNDNKNIKKEIKDGGLCYKFFNKDVGVLAYKKDNKIVTYKTANGGKIWRKYNLYLDNHWNKLDFDINIDIVDKENIFIILVNNSNYLEIEKCIFKSEGSIFKWTRIFPKLKDNKSEVMKYSNKFSIFTGVSYTNSKVAWYGVKTYGNQDPFIYKTEDGGENWNVQSLSIPPQYKNLKDLNINTYPPVFYKENGYLPVEYVLNKKVSLWVYKSKDGGKCWLPVLPIDMESGIELKYGLDNNGILWVLDNSGNKIYRLLNNETNVHQIWSEVNLKDKSIQFVEGSKGYTLIQNKIYFTKDKGITWESIGEK